MDFDKKTLFSELDKDIKKHAKKNDKKHKEKMGKIKSNDPFGYGFDPDDFNKKYFGIGVSEGKASWYDENGLHYMVLN